MELAPTTEDPNATKELASAKITYTNGSVSNGKLRKDADLTFKLEPVAGKILGAVSYKTVKADDTVVEANGTPAGTNGTYTISKIPALMHEVTAEDGTKSMVNDVNVTIIVDTTDVKYTVKADGESSEDYKLCELKTADSSTTADEEIAAAGKVIPYADKDKEISFAVVAAKENITSKIRSVSVTADGGEEKVITSTKATDDEAEDPIYTFKPSDLADLGLKENADQEITIKVTASGEATITIDTTGVATGATLGEVENAADLYGANKFAQPDNSGALTTAKEGQKVIFTASVTDDTIYKALTAADITATLDGESCTVTSVPANTEKKTLAHYMIDLADVIEDATLEISVKTELDETKDKVKSISFASVSENSIEVKSGSENVTGKTQKTTGANYTFDVTAKPGYQIYKVEAVYDKTYTPQDGKTTPAKVTGFKEDLTENFATKEDENGNTIITGRETELKNLVAKFTDTDSIGDGDAAETWTWTTKSVTINVYSDLKTFEGTKTVTFTNPEYEYEVTTGDKVEESDEDENTYTVTSGADFFTFTVDAVTEPVVATMIGEDSNTVNLTDDFAEKTEAGYVYKIPAGALGEKQNIQIARKTDKKITVNYKAEDVDLEVGRVGNAVALPSSTPTQDGIVYNGVTADYTYRFIIAAKDNAKIAKVSYKVGDAEEATEVKAKGGSYAFNVDVTGDVEVNVEMVDEYELVVREEVDDVEIVISPDKNKVYNVGHASTVTAQLLKGEALASLFNAEVKDGNAVAATIAKVEDDVVTLDFDSSEYNKVLTVVLTLDDKTKSTREFKVKTTAAAAKVALTGVKNGKAALPVDTKASFKLSVKTANATLTGLKALVVPADDEKKTDTTAINAARDLVSAEIKGDSLVITAAPAMVGTENVAKVIIVDESGLSDAQKAALNVDNALDGGVVTVSTTAATIVGKAPTVKFVSATDKEIKVQLGVPKGVVDPEVGEIYYKVEVTAPETLTFPAETSDADKTAITNAVKAAVDAWNNNSQYQAKSKIDKVNGLLAITVISDAVAKGVLLEGFKVKVTLMQTTTRAPLSSTTLATTIEGGNYELGNLATKNPYYEVKLGLKKGVTSLITGQDKDVTVATPNFNKLTSYSRVTVEFVDTSTGKIIGTDIEDEEEEEEEVYDTEYAGMYARYDELSNAVIVNAADSTYENNIDYNSYKNLGVKVTALAENSAYGAVATQKLTVVNGIENINPDAPLEVYKADGKPASFNVTVDLNGSSTEKKYAPKTKKLNYEIVGEDGTADSLNAAIRANVTVKNGKVTIAKGYIVTPKKVDNQFKVKVSAADYVDSNVIEYTALITITDEGLQMGDIAVFESSSLKGAGTATIEATRESGEYQVQVLQPGVKTTKKSYATDDYVPSNLLTFKSSNAKSVEVDENGNLKILKAAKNVKITAIPKDGSNPKPVKTLTLTVGQVASATPLLRITRYEDSTLNTTTKLYEGGATTLSYDGNNTNNYFKLEVVKAVTVGDETKYQNFYLANYSISYKGAKKVTQSTNSTGDEINIVANAKEATITLKDKANKSSTPVVYKLVNNSFVDAKGVTTPKIATTAKLTQNTWNGERYYTVKGGKNDDFTGKYVVMSIDQTKKNPGDIALVFADEYDEETDTVTSSYLDKPLPILLGERFNLHINTWSHTGNYNLIATVGSLENGVFKPEYKDAKVVVKIAKAKAASLSATGNYTLSLKASASTLIKYKSGNDYADFTNEAIDGNYAKNAIINGQENNFRDYFTAYYDEDNNYNMTIALKNLPLTAPQNDPDAPALDKIVANDATAKNNRIGYISINNGSKWIDVKLTITLKDYTADKTKYKVTATPVLEGPKAVSALTVMEGKSNVDIAWILVASEDKLFKAVFDRYGNLYLEATKAIEKRSYPVDLYIIPSNAPKAYRDAAAAATEATQFEVFEKYGVKTSINVTAADKTTTKNKVVLAKGGNTWNVADTDYNANSTNWSGYTSFSFKNKLSIAETTDITVKASVNNADIDYVTFAVNSAAGSSKYMSYETIGNKTYIKLPASYYMDFTLDKTKLAAAITANKALEANKQNKNLDWGKTLKVKATFSYGTNGPVEDEVTFNIKLPANAGADDTAVRAALNDEAFNKKLQSDIETYTKVRQNYYSNYAWYYKGKDTNAYVNYDVKSYIENEINKAIKGASVTVSITNNVDKPATQEDGDDGDDGDDGETPEIPTTTQVASEWYVTVTSKATGTPELYNKTFTIPTLSTTSVMTC